MTEKPLSADDIPLMLQQLLRSDYAEFVLAHIADLEAKLAEAEATAILAVANRQAMQARAEKAERDLAQSRELAEALKFLALRDPMKVHGPGDSFVRISTDEHKAIKVFVAKFSPTTGSAP